MLRSLHMENIAVIEKADVDFSPGLNVLTGETGAGKSIVIDSIEAVLGGRASRELVRSGADRAAVTAVFDAAGTESWCAENDVDAGEGELILHRRVTADGKTSARANGAPVAAAQLRELGALLLDIHGQNDGRQLLDEKRHLGYLDRFGVPEDVLAAYSEAYGAWKALEEEEKRLRRDDAEKERLEAGLRERVKELERAELRPGEEAGLMARRDLLRNAEKLTEQLELAYEALYEGDANALSLCADAESAADKASAWSADLAAAGELIRTARFSLEDAAERIRDKRAELDFSPEEYDRLEERLSQLRRLEKKYNADEAGLVSALEESRKRLDELAYAGERLLKLEKERKAAEKTAAERAAALTRARRDAAQRLEGRVVRELSELSMPSVRFRAEFSPVSGAPGFGAAGADSVRFLLSANAGEALGPISRIASGGELSRIMLALKNVFAERDAVPTQIFDEVDAGVSGVAAQRVGEKLAALSRTKQVICVTHLPQIAAMADTQFLVEKTEREGRTYTDVLPLDREGRMRELARLHGGEIVTAASLRSAAEQLDAAGQYKDKLRQKG